MNKCMNAVGSLLTHVASRRKRKPSGLKTRPPVRVRVWAPLAGALTSMPVTMPAGEAEPKPEPVSKQDMALRKLADEALPGRCHTLHEIADVMGITRERVRQIQQKALKKLHKRLGQIFRNEGLTPEDAVDVVRNVNSGGLEHAVMEKEK